MGHAFYRTKGDRVIRGLSCVLQQRPVSEITETIYVRMLNSLRKVSQPQLAGTDPWVWGVLPKELRADLFAAYDPKTVAQWTSFAEKVKRRKG